MSLNENNSEIITSAPVKYGVIGIVPSSSGAEGLKKWTSKYTKEGQVVVQPMWLKLTTNDLENTQIDTIWRAFPNQLKQLNKADNDSLYLARNITNMITQIESMLEPAPKQNILKALDVIAKLFQVELPIGQGLDLLIRGLEDIPNPLFKQACEHIALNVKPYGKFPVPAEFLEPIKSNKYSAERYLISLKEVAHRLS